MVKKIVLFGVFAFMVGCASQQKSGHHYHNPEYDGKCAYSMSHGKHDVEGNPEFQVNYKGKMYYFSNSDLRDHFLDEIKENIKNANNKWKEVRVPRGADR
tara:strand:- start:3031 stop:3330 length:300 start_codon:yes stop_codon:yes gene_type:complete